MTLNCIKTDFYAILPSGDYLYGDAFEMPGEKWPDLPILYPSSYLLLRVTSMSCERPQRVHIRLDSWSHWFDEQSVEVLSPAPDFAAVWRPSSTLIASPGQWSWLGYDGEAL